MSIRTALKPAEVKPFTERSNAYGAWLVVFNWGLVVLAFSLPILWPNVFTVLIGVILLANRQLGLAVLMHECAHNSLFASPFLNRWVGQVLCAGPVIADVEGYRRYHMKHHKAAGTDVDPDYPNYKHYPVGRLSMTRKILRDLTGFTAVKMLYAIVLMNAGVLSYDMSYQSYSVEKKLPAWQIAFNLVRNLSIPFTVHIAMFSVLWLVGSPWLYSLWWVSYATVYMLFLRIRNAAEHGSVPDLLSLDPQKHARTTQASWWERLTVAPNYVNFHMEHHLRPNVPCYRLRAFHQFLRSRNLVNEDDVANGYFDVMRRLVA